MVRLLESSVHKSAYSGPINMIPRAKWVCYVLPIHVACSIMQIRPLVPKIQQVTGLRGLCKIMHVYRTPLSSTLYNRLLADQTSHTRGSACLPPIICTQFSSELLSVSHPAITPRYHPKTHPHIGTLICRHTCSAFVLHSYFCFLRRWMRNTCGDSIKTKKHLLQSHGMKWFCRIKFGLSSDSPSH